MKWVENRSGVSPDKKTSFPNLELPPPPKLPWRGLVEVFHESRRASFSHEERYHRIEGSAMRRPIRTELRLVRSEDDWRVDLTINHCLLYLFSSSNRSKARKERIAGYKGLSR